MKVKIVLNGALSSCCSSYPTELVREVVRTWLRQEDELEVVDKQQGNWQPDELTSLAWKYFGDAIYPLLYIGDTLAAIGNLPDMNTLLDMISGKAEYGVTEKGIIEAAEKHGLLKKDEG